jgi:hypothetical protein
MKDASNEKNKALQENMWTSKWSRDSTVGIATGYGLDD